LIITGKSRFLPILATLILGGFTCLSLLSYLRARELMDRQITSGTLPAASDAIVSELEHLLLKPMLASGLMGGNNFIADNLLSGEPKPALIQDYLARIQRQTGAITSFLISDRSLRYYHPNGILKQISSRDPQDRWYYRFRESGRSIEINIDRDTADLNRTTVFINVPLRDRDGRFLGATGLGLDLRGLQQRLRAYQQRYGARILLVDREGQIALASDQSRGRLQQIAGLSRALPHLLAKGSSTEVISQRGHKLFVRANRIPETDWHLVVIQQRTAEQSAFIDLLAQNLAAAVALSLILVTLAHLTLGRAQQRLERLARTDLLSGLFNRSVFETLFQKHASSTKARGLPLAVALMDIDHFKAINDNHGHAIGDAVIRHVCQLIEASVGEDDPLFRWGGEEFLLLLPGCDLGEARERLERIRRQLRAHPFALPEASPVPQQPGRMASGDRLAVTLSLGLALHVDGEPSAEVVRRADRALYAAKQAGRDCIREDGAVGPGTESR
jgi:diguanylate cyclase (GGDEF)-like protein